MTYPQQPPNGQAYYPQHGHDGQVVYVPQQQQYPYPAYPAPRIPSPYGWGIWVTLIGVLMLFAGLAAPALASGTPSADCSAQEQQVERLTREYEAAVSRRDSIPLTNRAARAAAHEAALDASKKRSAAINERIKCTSTANTGAAPSLAGFVVLIGGFAPLTIGIGMTRILAGGDLMTRLGGGVHRRVARARASRPAPQFAPVQPQPQPMYEQPQPFVQDFPVDYDEPAAPTAPEPERPREGWSNRRNLNFGGDD